MRSELRPNTRPMSAGSDTLPGIGRAPRTAGGFACAGTRPYPLSVRRRRWTVACSSIRHRPCRSRSCRCWRRCSPKQTSGGTELAEDETYIKVGSQWNICVARSIDGKTIRLLASRHRDYAAARCFFERAIDVHGVAERSPSTRATRTSTSALTSIIASTSAANVNAFPWEIALESGPPRLTSEDLLDEPPVATLR